MENMFDLEEEPIGARSLVEYWAYIMKGALKL